MSGAARPADVLKYLESARINFSLCYRLLQRAIGLVGMVAVVETAFTQVRGKLDKALFNFAETQVVQAKHLDTGAIDEMAIWI